MKKLLGKPLSEKDRDGIARMREEGGSVNLVCILSPDSDDSVSYLHQIERLAEKTGTKIDKLFVSDAETASRAVSRIEKPKGRDSFIILRPIPLIDDSIALKLDSRRDPDCFGSLRRSEIYSWGKDVYLPATARSVMRLIESSGIETKGKKALVIGRSLSVGLPVFHALMRADALVSLAHSKVSPKTLKEEARRSDILVLASGHRGLIDETCIHDGQVIIDCGFHASDRGGDLGFVPNESIQGFYTPVPGGVGPLTVVSLLHNAYSMLRGVK